MASDQTPTSPLKRLSSSGRWALFGGIAIVAVVAIAIAIANSNPNPRPASTLGIGVTPSNLSSNSASASESPTASGSLGAPDPSATIGTGGRKALPPVGLSASATPTNDVVISLANIESVDGKGSGQGEVSGPSIRFQVVVTNNTASEVSLSSTVVNVTYGAESTPASELSGPGGVALPQSVAAGQKATGVFIFSVPKDQRGDVTITVDSSVSAPIVVFQGSAPS